MSEPIFFSEKQRFTQWWLWAILFGLNGLMFVGIIQQIGFGKPFGTKPASDAGLLIAAAFCLGMLLLFFSFKLETVIEKNGVYVRFYPFHLKFKHYDWSEIKNAYVRKYSPLKEFGGWGVRFGNKGNALNMSGNQGLQLEFGNRRNLLIGTRRPDEIASALTKLFPTS
jgi:hypothetical protein